VSDNVFDQYEQKAKEDQMTKSAVSFLLTMINQSKADFDNDSILRIGKNIQNEIVKLVGEVERNGKKP